MAGIMGIPVPYLNQAQTQMLLVGVVAALGMMVATMPGVVTPQSR